MTTTDETVIEEKLSLEEQIQQRRKEGDSLFYPAMMAALAYGIPRPKRHGSIMMFSAGTGNAHFTIHYDTYWPNLSVYDHNDECVLRFTQRRIQRYRPGSWVDCLLTFGKQAIREDQQRKAEAKEREFVEKLHNWGLD